MQKFIKKFIFHVTEYAEHYNSISWVEVYILKNMQSIHILYLQKLATEYDEANTKKYQIYFRRRGGNVIFKTLSDWKLYLTHEITSQIILRKNVDKGDKGFVLIKSIFNIIFFLEWTRQHVYLWENIEFVITIYGACTQTGYQRGCRPSYHFHSRNRTLLEKYTIQLNFLSL